MTTQDANKRLLATMYAAASRGEPAGFLDGLHEQLQWTIMGSTIFSGTWRGKNEVVEKAFRPVYARLAAAPIQFTVKQIVAEGETVVMQASGSAMTREGLPYNNEYCIVARFRDGKVAEVSEYLDTDLVRRTFATDAD